MIETLASSEMTAQLAHHFGDDIRDAPIILKARRCDDLRAGGIHTDARGKLVTVLIYLNASWSDQAGCLRVLRFEPILHHALAHADAGYLPVVLSITEYRTGTFRAPLQNGSYVPEGDIRTRRK